MAATPMFDLAVPGHERDAMWTSHDEPIDVVGFDDARQELDALAVREYAAVLDEYTPTPADERIALMASLG